MKFNLNPTDILIPRDEDSLTNYSVVACDQYTSQPEYWERVEKTVADNPSAYNLVFPEAYLETVDFDEKVNSINSFMTKYLEDKVYKTFADTIVYVERTLKNGKVRKGLIGAIDLEDYDYNKGSEKLIRATEGTVIERIPPRVKIRENAPLELPHVMLLIDDPKKTIIEPISKRVVALEKIYDFELMENSGSIKGYKIEDMYKEILNLQLNVFADKTFFNNKYGTTDLAPMLFAVGDGNHSLATAKTCYENIKATLSEEEALKHPARYALVEIVNLHDSSLEFEAIHREVFNADPEHLLGELYKAYDVVDGVVENAQTLKYVIGKDVHEISITNPDCNLAVGTLQKFLDNYNQNNYDIKIDYIHGEDVIMELSQKPDTIGFILPCMEKDELFKTVILDSALPRKTFSMGEACDKRFYLEARKIK